MKVLRRSFLVSAALLCLSVATTLDGAQESRRRGKWWQAEEVRRELGLTEEQSNRIEGLFQATLPELRVAKTRLDEVQAELSRLLGDESTDETLVSRQVDHVESARGGLSKLRTLMLFRIDRVLSPDQRVKLKALHDRSRRRDGGDGQGQRHFE